MAFGFGLWQNIEDAYLYLMNHYEVGDRVFLFGFSRGAYTVRSVAGLLRLIGLLRRGNDNLVRHVVEMFKRTDSKTFGIAPKFKAVFSRECKPYFVGIWDTVSSVGWIYDPVKLPYTRSNPDIQVGRHAISIDERRCFFRQNLWGPPEAGQDLKQVWFAGVHSDVGGGYPEKESGLSKISLEWVVREAMNAGLVVDDAKLDKILGRTDDRYARADASGLMHKSLRGFWKVLEFWPKRYVNMRKDPPVTEWKIPRSEARWIAEGSLIHETVFGRKRALGGGYEPSNLPKQYVTES